MTDAPLPPSPPSGPPLGTYFSRRNETHPFPPSPAFTWIVASSTNMPGDHTPGVLDASVSRALTPVYRDTRPLRSGTGASAALHVAQPPRLCLGREWQSVR